MEKRSTVDAVVAEGLVFESNFGGAREPAAGSRPELAKRAQPTPAWNAAALAAESIRTDDPAT